MKSGLLKLLLCFLDTYWVFLISHQKVCDRAIKASSVLLPLGGKCSGHWGKRHKAIQKFKLTYLLEDFTLILHSWVTGLKAPLFLFLKQIRGITSKMKVLHCLTVIIWPFCLVRLCLMKKWICTSSFKRPSSFTHIHYSIRDTECLHSGPDRRVPQREACLVFVFQEVSLYDKHLLNPEIDLLSFDSFETFNVSFAPQRL